MWSKKTRWPIVIAGIVLVAILSTLGVFQARQTTEKNRLNSEIAAAELGLDEFRPVNGVYPLEAVKEHINDATLTLDEARAQLSESTDSIEAEDTLFAIAELSGVEIQNINIAPVSSDNLVDINCTTLSVATTVEGEVPQLLDFVMALNTDVTNGAVGSAKISVPSGTDEQAPTAEVNMVIYYYEEE